MRVIGVASGGLAGAFYCNNPKKTPPPYTAIFNPINPLSNPTLPESAFRLIPELENTASQLSAAGLAGCRHLRTVNKVGTP